MLKSYLRKGFWGDYCKVVVHLQLTPCSRSHSWALKKASFPCTEADRREGPPREVKHVFLQCWAAVVPTTFSKDLRGLLSAQKVFLLLHLLISWTHCPSGWQLKLMFCCFVFLPFKHILEQMNDYLPDTCFLLSALGLNKIQALMGAAVSR